MNRFDDDLRRAARGKRTTAVIASFAIFVFGLVLAGYFLSFRSLLITVQPKTPNKPPLLRLQTVWPFPLPVAFMLSLTKSSSTYPRRNFRQQILPFIIQILQ